MRQNKATKWRNDVTRLLVSIGAFAVVLGVLTWRQIINTPQFIELLLIFTLVLVTLMYAKRTSKIADASVRMAEEMRAQRYSESLPLLVPRVPQIFQGAEQQ